MSCSARTCPNLPVIRVGIEDRLRRGTGGEKNVNDSQREQLKCHIVHCFSLAKASTLCTIKCHLGQLTSVLIFCHYFKMGSDSFRIITIPAALKPRTGLIWFWLVVLFLIPLFPLTDFVGHPHWDAIRWIPFQDFSLTVNMLVDIIGNIGWFMIFGYLLHYWMDEHSSAFRSIATVVLIAAGVSLSLEFFQVFCHNRIPSMTDIVCDTIGGCLGAYFSEEHRSTDSPEPARYLVIEEDGSKTLL